jgi:hypothetical protein
MKRYYQQEYFSVKLKSLAVMKLEKICSYLCILFDVISRLQDRIATTISISQDAQQLPSDPEESNVVESLFHVPRSINPIVGSYWILSDLIGSYFGII